MSMFRGLVLPACAVLAAIGAWQWRALGGDAYHHSASGVLEVEELVLHPTPAPRPALKYRLLPSLGEQEPGVAAPLYAQAFLAVQERKVDDATWEKLQGKWPNAPLAELPKEEMRKALAPLRPVLDCVDEAARRPRYGLEIAPRDYARIVPTLLPQLYAFRVIARLILVRCRLQILDGDFEGAVRSLKTGYAMARHCAEQPTVLHALMGTTLTLTLNRELRELVQMPRAPNLYWAITAMPERIGDPQAVSDFDSLVFQATFADYERAKVAGAGPEQWWAMLDKLVPLLPRGQVDVRQDDKQSAALRSPEARKKYLETALAKALPIARQILRAAGITEATMDKMSPAELAVRAAVEMYDAQRDDVAKWCHAPYWQAKPALDKQSADLGRLAREAGISWTPAGEATTVTPWAEAEETKAVIHAAARCQRDRAALRCLEAIRLYAATHGKLPRSLEDITEAPVPVNPLTGKPFPYRAEERYVILNLNGDHVNFQWWVRLAD